MTRSDADIVSKLEDLDLQEMASAYKECIDKPEFSSWSLSQAMAYIIDSQHALFIDSRMQKLLKSSRLMSEDGDISMLHAHDGRIYSPANLLEQLKTLDFIRNGYNLTIIGASDAGKTYMASSLGIEACRCGLSPYFISYAELCDTLRIDYGASYARKRTGRKKAYRTAQMLIVDDFLMVADDDEVIRTSSFPMLFFELLKERQKHGLSTVVTTQFSPDEWSQVIPQTKNSIAAMDSIRRRLINEGFVTIVEKKNEG